MWATHPTGAVGRGPTRSTTVGRVGLVLDILAATNGAPLPVREIARRTGLATSSTARLVADMVEHNLLERTVRGIQAGPRLLDAHSAAHEGGTRRWALSDMTRLHHRTHRAVRLAILDGADAHYLAVVPHNDPRYAAAQIELGSHRGAYATAAGKALLAWAPTATLAALGDDLPQLEPTTLTHPALLARELAAVSSTGVAYDLEESGPGTACVAAPIYRGRERPAALSIDVTGVDPTKRRQLARRSTCRRGICFKP